MNLPCRPIDDSEKLSMRGHWIYQLSCHRDQAIWVAWTCVIIERKLSPAPCVIGLLI